MSFASEVRGSLILLPANNTHFVRRSGSQKLSFTSPRSEVGVCFMQHNLNINTLASCNNMASLPNELRQGTSGLSHLVEAASALTALVDSKAPSKEKTGASDAVVSDDDESLSKKLPSKATKKKEIFPEKLMEILMEQSLSNIVSWLPHGRSFVIIRPDIFTDEVLPKYLPPVDARASTKYPSFTRKLNRW